MRSKLQFYLDETLVTQMNKDYLDYIYAISLLIGIIGGIFFGIKLLYKSFKSTQRKRREQVIGNWTNEGSIGGNESH